MIRTYRPSKRDAGVGVLWLSVVLRAESAKLYVTAKFYRYPFGGWMRGAADEVLGDVRGWPPGIASPGCDT